MAYQALLAANQVDDAARVAQLTGEDASLYDAQGMAASVAALLKANPAGGLMQADRATLFLANGATYGVISASLVDGAWIFDSSRPAVYQDDPRQAPPDCNGTRLFACGAASFPDAKVAGTARVDRSNPNNQSWPASPVLLDGYAVRMLDPQTKALKYTQVLLSAERNS